MTDYEARQRAIDNLLAEVGMFAISCGREHCRELIWEVTKEHRGLFAICDHAHVAFVPKARPGPNNQNMVHSGLVDE
jgi:hypothetical protein